MASTIQVNLQFNANTQQAKSQIQTLQTTLNQAISQANSSPLSITPQIQQATQSAMQLKVALNNAMNTNTGQLNLNQFLTQLKTSGISVKQLAADMQMLGPQGVQAFNQLSQAVTNSNTKIFSMGASMKKLFGTLTSNVRWQLTSFAIQGVTQAISGTIDYARKLNESLNNIQIVSGKSADQMARFAKEANQAAKNLSTTTTEYTNASLIFFQQGLNEAEVKKRTDTVIRLANVTGETVAQASGWMTAIWNNFDDGSKSLEYYADVLAKLGAATASSADEIAGGLEKFAAVAETVGLSYEYAASALATITAETRQSEDVVGTALKTIFSRMEGLKLGETLDDGTTLNKYSLALQTVGVNVKDVNGELKDMDIILNETGRAWELLTKDQQVALAQSVAGVRQYTQFIALMDNWDIMQRNLDLVEDANGALLRQNAIYAEGAEAAKARKDATAEELMGSLFGGDDLKAFYDGLTEVFKVITDIIDAIGGVKGILIGVSAILLNLYKTNIAGFIANTANSFTLLGSGAQKAKAEFVELASQMSASQNLQTGLSDSAFGKQNLEIREKMLSLDRNLSEIAKQKIQWEMELLEQQQAQVAEAEKLYQLAQETAIAKREQAIDMGVTDENTTAVEKVATTVGSMEGNVQNADIITSSMAFQQAGTIGNVDTGLMQSLTEQITAAKSSFDSLEQESIQTGDSASNAFLSIEKALENPKTSITDLITLIQTLKDALAEVGNQAIEGTINGIKEQMQADVDGGQGLVNSLNNLENIDKNTPMESIRTNTRTILDNRDQFTDDSQADLDRLQQADSRFAAAESRNTAAQSALTEAQSAVQADQDNGIHNQEHIDAFSKAQKEATAAQQEFNEAQESYKKIGNDFAKNMKKGTDAQEKATKATKKGTKTKKSSNKEEANGQKGLKAGTKGYNAYTKKVDKATEAMEEHGDATRKAAKDGKVFEKGMQDTIKNGNKLSDSLNNGGKSFEHWSNTIANGIGKVATIAMGIQMLTSGFENLGRAMGEGKSFGEALKENFVSIAMAASMILPMIIKMTTGVYSYVASKVALRKASEIEQGMTQAEITLSEGKITINNLEGRSELEQAAMKAAALQIEKKVANGEIANDKKIIASEITKTAARLMGHAAKGPVGWGILAACLALILPLAGMVGAAFGSFNTGSAEAAQENETEALEASVERGNTQLEAIKENRELADSVGDLAEEYEKLQESGGNTYDTLEELKDQVPDLIESYEKLNRLLGDNTINVDEIKRAYENFLVTGDITWLDSLLEEADRKAGQAQTQTAKGQRQTLTTAAINAMHAGEGNWGYIEGNAYKMHLADGEMDVNDAWSEDEAQIMRKYMGTTNNGGFYSETGHLVISDKENPEAIKKYYEGLGQVLTAYEEKFGSNATKMGRYQILLEEYGQMTEYYDQIIEQDNLILNSFIENGSKADKDIEGITSIKDYNTKKDAIINQLVEEGLSKDQALEYLKTKSSFAKGAEFFEVGGSLDTILADSALTLEQVQNWWSNLPEEDRTLALNMNFDGIDTIEELEANYAEFREQKQMADIETNAASLDIDLNTFNAYSEILADANEGLEENTALTKQAALNNIKVGKGLGTLQKNWDKTSKALSNNNRNSFEYAEAIGNIKTALEEAFGYAPSVELIEKNLGSIQQIAQGNLESLDELQSALAEEYVANLEFRVANNGIGFTKEQMQNTLFGFLDELDTTITLGDSVTIDQQYYNALQDMLDSGQLTYEELQQMMRMKGFEMKVTGWKEVDGPIKTITRSYNNPMTGVPYTETWTETEKIKVPIINGDDTGIISSEVDGNASVIRSVTADSVISSEMHSGAEDKKDLDEEVERYENITSAIDRAKDALELLSKAKERAYGPARLKLMDEEIKRQEQIVELEKEKLRQIEEKYKKDYAAARAYGLEIDENGVILNAEEVRTSLVEQVNAGIINEETYKKAKSIIDQVKETNQKYYEQLENVQEAEYTLKDKELEIITDKVEYKIELDEKSIDLIQYQIDNLEDDIYGAAESLALVGQQTEKTLSKTAIYTEGISSILMGAGATVDQIEAFMAGDTSVLENLYLEKEEVDYLFEYSEGLQECNESLKEYKDFVAEQVLNAFEDMSDQLEKNINLLEHYNNVLSSYKDITDLLGRNNYGITDSMLKTLRDTTMNNAINQTEAARLDYEAKKAALDESKHLLDIGAITEEEYQEIYDSVQEAHENLLSSFTEGLQTAADNFSTAMEQISASFSETVAGAAKSLDELETQFNNQKELSELYVEDYTKIYNLSKLNREINKSINATDSIRAKNKLRELEEEIITLQKSGKEMSQYELDVLQKKYDLRIAEIALEEAQEAKKQVRMQRDAEGNWNYVYTADATAIDQAQQKLEDALYASQSHNTDYIKNVQSQIISIQKAYTEEIKKIEASYTRGSEEWKEKMQEIENRYNQQMQYYSSQLKIALNNNHQLYTTDWQRYSEATGYKISANIDFIDSFEETVYSQLTGFNTMEDAYKAFSIAVKNSIDKVNLEFISYKTNVELVMNAAGTSADTFATDFEEAMKRVREASDDAADSAEQMKDDMIDAFSQISGAAATFNSDYATQINGAMQKNTELITSITSVIAALKDLNSTNSSLNLEIANPLAEDITTSGAPGHVGYVNKGYVTSTGSGTFTLYSSSGHAVRQDASDSGAETIDLLEKNEAGNYVNNILRAEKLTGQFGPNSADGTPTPQSTFYYVEMKDGRTGYVSEKEWESIQEYKKFTTNNLTGDNPTLTYHKVLDLDDNVIADKVAVATSVDENNKPVNYAIYEGQLAKDNLSKIDENLPSVYEYQNQFPIIEVLNNSLHRPYHWKNNMWIEKGITTSDMTNVPAGKYYVHDIGQGGWNLSHSAMLALSKDDNINYFSGGSSDVPYMTARSFEYHYDEENGSYKDNLKIISYPKSGPFNNSALSLLQKSAAAYDTGGYTGEWDSSGRIAMLHQKEIVLNAHDTENFLSAINILRDIVSVIDLKAISQSMNLSNNISSSTVSPFTQTLEQEVTIHAEFPNATNRTEIEEAFDSLLNRASQYANRK